MLEYIASNQVGSLFEIFLGTAVFIQVSSFATSSLYGLPDRHEEITWIWAHLCGNSEGINQSANLVIIKASYYIDIFAEIAQRYVVSYRD